jgi:hypothetical protein
MISKSSATSFLRSSLGTWDLRRRRSHSFLDRAIISALGFAALRSCANAFCLAWLSRDELSVIELENVYHTVSDTEGAHTFIGISIAIRVL